MPKVAVIVPAYNAEKYVGKCIESVLAQSLANFELIVVDDGSSDSTQEIVSKFAKVDSRVRLLSQRNSYAGVARNNGFKESSSEYAYFLDADDFIDPYCLERMASCMDEDSSDVLICRAESYDNQTSEIVPMEWTVSISDGRYYESGSLDDNLFQSCVGWPWDKMFRSSFIRENRIKYQDLRTSNDAYFVFMALCLADRVSVIPDALVFHRVNNSQSLENTRSSSWENAVKAALAIEDGLKERGLFGRFERSFNEWLFHFSFWNYMTLEGGPKKGVLRFMEDEVAPRLTAEAVESFEQLYERKAAAVLITPSGDLLEAALDVCREYKHGLEEIGELDRSCRSANDAKWGLQREKDELEARLSSSSGKIEELSWELRSANSQLEALRNSASFKVGRAVTALPRRLRDMVRR